MIGGANPRVGPEKPYFGEHLSEVASPGRFRLFRRGFGFPKSAIGGCCPYHNWGTCVGSSRNSQPLVFISKVVPGFVCV